MIKERPPKELKWLAPRIDELGQAVAVGVLYLAVRELIAAEDRAPNGGSPVEGKC